nr:LacI family DNA-binding transcriptional regulator [uncultured Cohaesibacter sp.]
MAAGPKQNPTLRQVAEHAGVSVTTASLVLNRKGEISENTRANVLRAMAELNYTPRGERSNADSDASDAQNAVRFLKIVRHGQTLNRDHNVFISDYIDGMSYEATRRDYSLQVVSHEAVDVASIIDEISKSDLRGIVALGTELSDEDIHLINGCGVPNVIIDTYRPFVDGNFIDMDNEQLVYLALAHLASNGFRRIGLVSSYSEVNNFKLRHEAYMRAMNAHGLEIEEENILSVCATIEEAYEDSIKQLSNIKKLSDAYFCANDVIAFGFIRALRELGYSVPGDISVVGFDNLPMASMFDPPLTSLNVPKQRIGAMAIRFLDDLIVANEKQPPVKVLLSGDLVIRKSVKLAD